MEGGPGNQVRVLRAVKPVACQRVADVSHVDPQLVGEVIAARRKKKGISQEVLSGLADIGRTHLSAIERGERKPTLETLYRIACALDVPMSALVLDMEAEMARRQG